MAARWRLHLAQTDHGIREMKEAHEGGGGFLAAQGNAPEAFELIEEAVDLITSLVKSPFDGGRFGSDWP